MTTSSAEPSVDDVLSVLSSAKRRELLVSLVADSPPDSTAPTAVDVTVDREMYHRHLPKLVDHGLVVWERDSNTVERGPHFEAAGALLESLAEHDEALFTDEVAQ